MSEKDIFKDLYGSIAAAKEAGISLRQLYHWVDDLHIVQPHLWRHGLRRFRRFTPQDVEKLKELRRRVEQGYTLQAAARLVRDPQRSNLRNREAEVRS